MRKFCAHRGLPESLTENTLPSFAAAIALGADEIEFDVRVTKDGDLAVSHDDKLGRITGMEGEIASFTMDQLRQIPLGSVDGVTYGYCSAEDVFSRFANQVVFNVHVKNAGTDGYPITELMRLIERYRVHGNVYFAGVARELAFMQRLAPEIPRVAIQTQRTPDDIVGMAREYGCAGIQFWVDRMQPEMIEDAHASGMFCNFFHAEDADGFGKYFDMGIDTILTNRMDAAAEYLRGKQA